VTWDQLASAAWQIPQSHDRKLKQAATAVEPLTYRQAPHNLEAEQALWARFSSTTRRSTA
jgi:hypothetical protein